VCDTPAKQRRHYSTPMMDVLDLSLSYLRLEKGFHWLTVVPTVQPLVKVLPTRGQVSSVG
jgi:hypothetical protein